MPIDYFQLTMSMNEESQEEGNGLIAVDEDTVIVTVTQNPTVVRDWINVILDIPRPIKIGISVVRGGFAIQSSEEQNLTKSRTKKRKNASEVRVVSHFILCGQHPHSDQASALVYKVPVGGPIPNVLRDFFFHQDDAEPGEPGVLFYGIGLKVSHVFQFENSTPLRCAEYDLIQRLPDNPDVNVNPLLLALNPYQALTSLLFPYDMEVHHPIINGCIQAYATCKLAMEQ